MIVYSHFQICPPLAPSLASSIQSTSSFPVYLKSSLILSFHVRLNLIIHLPTKNIMCIFLLSHTCYMPRLSNLPWFVYPNNMLWEVKMMNLHIMQFSPPSAYQNVFLSTLLLYALDFPVSVSFLDCEERVLMLGKIKKNNVYARCCHSWCGSVWI
jgi:hypothetical protein